MKKLLLLIVLASLYANLSYSQCAPIFADDFETGTLLPHWVSGTQSNTTTINSTASPQGTYHMQYTSTTTAHYQGRKAIIPATQISEISWWVKSDGLVNGTGYTVIGPTGTTGSTCIFFGYFNSSNQYVCTGGPSDHYQPVTYGTWYHIELKNINWVTRTLDIYFNNSLVQTGFAFRGSGTSVSEVHLYNYAAATSYFDDVQVYAPISVTVNATPDTICAGETTKVSAVAPTPTDSIRWYDAMSGGNILATTLSGDSITLTPNADTTLYPEVYIPNLVSTTIGYTGGLDSFIVPAGVTSLDIQAYGAQGNANAQNRLGGLGGQANGTLAVTPGQTIYIQVGGGGDTTTTGGYNGGGTGGTTLNCANAAAGGGGGSTDIMVGGTSAADRVMVAGGGGGAGGNRVQGCGRGSGGGGGGGYYGGGGGAAWPQNGTMPTGGSQTAAGVGGTSTYTGAAPGNNGGAASGAIGGTGGAEIGSSQGGNGIALAGGTGGGTTGGNGQYSVNWTGASGAGGSGYTGGTGVTAGAMLSGVRSGNGQVIINWQVPPCPVQRASITVTVDSIPNVTATPSNVTSCYGDSVTLVGGGSDTYSWTGGIMDNTPFLPASSGVYTVTGTDASGCSNTATANVTLGSAAVPAAFADDFESGLTVLPHWTTINGTATISTTASPQGNNNVQYVGVSAHYQGMKGTFAAAQPIECSWYMKTANLNNSGYVVLGDSNTASNNGIVFSYFRSTGDLRFYANPTNEYVLPATANTWYFIELKNINWTAKTYDIYIDNILRQTAFPFRNTASTYMSQVNLYNFASTTSNFDDIKIGGSSIKLSNATAGNAASTAGSGTGTKMQNANVALEYYDNNCDLIAEISNNASALGNTVTGVTVDATVPTHNGQPFTARWFEITPSNNVAADVKLFFTQDDFDDYNTYATTNSWPLLPTGPSDAAGIANVRVTKNDNAGLGTNPLVLTPTSVVWNPGGVRWEVMVSTPSFSQFRAHAVNPANTPLPVTFTNFGVRKVGTVDLVEWTTKGEYNNSHFIVQRSADGHIFENLGTVYTKANNGNSSIDLSYEFTDEKPLTGHNYYRLQQVDLDNNISYSQIVDIVWDAAGSAVSVYPNPVKDMLNVDVSTNQVSNVEIKVMDMSGRVVKSLLTQTQSGLNNMNISMHDVAPGVYGVQVYENNKLKHVQKVRKSD